MEKKWHLRDSVIFKVPLLTYGLALTHEFEYYKLWYDSQNVNKINELLHLFIYFFFIKRS